MVDGDRGGIGGVDNELVVAEDVTVDLAPDRGVDGAVDGEGGVFGVERVPSLNFTPWWMRNVHVFGEVCSQESASLGSRSPLSGLRSMRGSVMLERTTGPVAVSEASHGSSVGGSWGSTMRRVSGSAASVCVVLATEHPVASAATAAAATTARRVRREAGCIGAAACMVPPL